MTVHTSPRPLLVVIKRHPQFLQHISITIGQVLQLLWPVCALPRLLSTIRALSTHFEDIRALSRLLELLVCTPSETVPLRWRLLDHCYELLQVPDVLGKELQITVVASFEPQWFILLFTKFPQLLAMGTVYNFIRSTLHNDMKDLVGNCNHKIFKRFRVKYVFDPYK